MTPPDPMPARRAKGWTVVRLLATAIAVCLVGWFVVGSITRDARAVDRLSLTIQWDMVALSIPFLIASHAVLPLAWRRISRFFGYPLSYRSAAAILFVSNIARYVPGRILTVLSQVTLSARDAIPARVSLATAIFYLLVTSWVAVEVSLLTFGLRPDTPRTGKAFAALALLGLLLLSTKTGLVARGPLARLVGSPGGGAVRGLRARDALLLHALLASMWVPLFIGIHLLLAGLASLPLHASLWVTGTLATSWLVGFWLFLTPGGIGVREGVQMFLLGPLLPAPLPALIPVVLRVWMTVGDLLVLGAGMVARSRRLEAMPFPSANGGSGDSSDAGESPRAGGGPEERR